jgi:death on curing protein
VRYLTADHLRRINDSLSDAPGVIEQSRVEAAVERPQQSAFGEPAYPTIHTKAAALMQSIACGHAFVQGNKRTATLAVNLFYNLNGWMFEADDTGLIHLVLDVTTGNLKEIDDIAARLEGWAHEMPDVDL